MSRRTGPDWRMDPSRVKRQIIMGNRDRRK
jgi:hypothetical protein